jgi:iron complex outermembrane receptor protein
MFSKRLLGGAALAAFGFAMAGAAHAQSTGTQQVEEKNEIVVTGQRGPRSLEGLLAADSAAKTRSVVTQDYIATQSAGQTIMQTLNLTPGLNFTNDDPYGSSGGNVRLHGLDGNHIGLLIDGVPLNDAGNYAIYPNQQLDPELIEQANVNASSADADTATASSTGGIINYTTLRTAPDLGVILKQSFGDFQFSRSFGLLQTGQFGPWGTSAWLSANYQRSNKFKGPGNLEKKQFNFRIQQPLRDKDFISVTGNYNENRNDFFYLANLATSTGFCDIAKTKACPAQVDASPFGWEIDYPAVWVPPTVRPGVADSVPFSNSAIQGFYGLKINPSNTGTLRGSSSFALGDRLTLTVDPAFNYVLANGGGTTNAVEAATNSSAPLRGAATTFPTCTVGTVTTGRDLNGDGDCMDTVQVYSPSTTNTYRYDVNSSLIWNITDKQLVRFAYAWDYGRTRQTGEWGFITSSGFPEEVFSGKPGHGRPVLAADGNTIVQKRDRFSIATLNQPSIEYRGRFLDDALSVSLGVRAPFLKRELHQFCFTPTNSTSFVYCTGEIPTAPAADGTVGFATQGSTRYFRPYAATKKFDDILPNAGVSYRFAENNMVFVSYTEQQSAPKVDNLYTLTKTGALGDVLPETSQSYDFGYRYQSGTVLASLSGYFSEFHNRIVSTRDPTDDTIIDRNVGDVQIRGADAQLGVRVTDPLFVYASATYTDSELQDNLFVGGTAIFPGAGLAAGFAPTKGKELVETPRWMFGARAQLDLGMFQFGLQGKYVGKRWVTDVNDLRVDSYTVADLDITWRLDELGAKGSSIQINATNIFDERYYASLKGTQTSSTPGAPGGPNSSTTGTTGNAFAAIGAPRALMVTIKSGF